jgi:hypothetical protein
LLPDRPIRVVLFGGGPGLETGLQRLLCRLDDHGEILLLGAVCQSPGNSIAHIARDLWKRRRWLALPLLAGHMTGSAGRFLTQGSKGASVRRRLHGLRDRIQLVPDIHAPEVLEHVRSLAPDLGLIYGSPILRPELFTIPALGTLGIHHGSVPRYRGKKTTFWEMYHGETHAGVTIQRVGSGLDTGDIVEQAMVPIGARSRRRVWAELEALGVELYVGAILKVRAGAATSTPQTGPRYALCRDPSMRQILGLWWRQLRARAGVPLPPGPGPTVLPPSRKRTV